MNNIFSTVQTVNVNTWYMQILNRIISVWFSFLFNLFNQAISLRSIFQQKPENKKQTRIKSANKTTQEVNKNHVSTISEATKNPAAHVGVFRQSGWFRLLFRDSLGISPSSNKLHLLTWNQNKAVELSCPYKCNIPG